MAFAPEPYLDHEVAEAVIVNAPEIHAEGH